MTKINRLFSNKPLFSVLKSAVFFLFVLFLPTQLGKHFFFNFSYINGVRVDYLSLVLYFTDVLFLTLFLLNIDRVRESLRKHKKALFVLFPLFVLNIVFSSVKIIALYRLLKIAQIYLLFVIVKRKDKRRAGIALLTGGVFELILALAQLIERSSLQGVFYLFGERYLAINHPGVAKAAYRGIELLRPYATFSHPNSLGGFYLLVFFFALSTNLKTSPLVKNGLLFVSAALIILSFSKAALFTFVFLSFLYLLLGRKIDCKLCLLAKIVLSFALIFFFLQTRTDPYSLEKRLLLLRNSFSVIIQHPIFGVGLGNYLYFEARFSSPFPYFFLQPVHNIFILFLAEVGFLLGGAVFYYLYRLIKKRLKVKGFVFCLLAVFLTGLVDHYWVTLQQNWLLLPVLFGLLHKKKQA